MNCAAIVKSGLLVAALAVATSCGGDNKSGGTSNASGTGGSGGSAATGGSSSPGGTSATVGGAAASGGTSSTAGGSSPGGTTGTVGGSSVGGETNAGGTAGAGGGGAANAPYVYFAKQANGTTTASMTGGVISVSAKYGSSGNAFKFATPNLYYGTSSNGFIAYPTPMTGDFGISAQVTVTTQNKNNNACGIGLGVTTGFDPTDTYAFVVMRNAATLNAAGVTNTLYVSGAGAIANSGGPTVSWTNGTPVQLSFTRVGTTVTMSAGPVGGTPTTQTFNTSALTDGTTAYGGAAVYPAISFNNVDATISKLVVKDATGATVYDSDAGTLVNYVPAALTVSQLTASVKKGASTTVLATSNAIGGGTSTVTATADDPTIVEVSVTSGATNSTINLNGLKGGATYVTITNSADTNTATNSKRVLVSVNDYEATDGYGSLASVAYPAPGVTNAYADGELALTFDSVPTLNVGGSIKIFNVADGTEVDSVAFANEMQIYGTASAPVPINVGSQLVRVSGNTVYFAPHLGKLAYGTAYYVVIPTTSITGTLNGTAFNGMSDQSSVATWNFTTRTAPTLDPTNITVDGSPTSTANFRTIQAALNAAATSMAGEAVVNINVAAGTYNELLRYVGPGAAQTVHISGPAGNNQGDTCVVQWANGNTINGSTATRPTFYFNTAHLVLENMTFKNTGVRSAVAQAETLYFAGGATAGTTLAVFNSAFYSNQDTIQTSGRNWFYKSFIEGNVDFVWGTADAALFENCTLHFANETSGTANTYSLAVARTGTTVGATANGIVGKGYVFLNSTVNVDAAVTAYFGRDAGGSGFYDQVALVNVAFTGSGTVGAGLWNVQTTPLAIGDSSYVGWKSAGCTGLNLASLTTATGTSSVIANQDTEYDTRDHILNRVVTVTSGVPSGYQAAATAWDVSALASVWNAP